MTNNRQPANYQDIASALKAIIPMVEAAHEDVSDILDYEMNAGTVRNVVAASRELKKAIGSLSAAAAVALNEVD